MPDLSSKCIATGPRLAPPVLVPPISPTPAEWSGALFDPTLSRPELLQQLFEAQVDLRPNQPAVCCGGAKLTYAELDCRANQIAQLLHSKGIGRGSFVGMLLPRSAEVYVALLGILKAGAAYVPLDPSYPADRVQFILDDSNVKALVSVSKLANTLSLPAHVPAILLDSHASDIASQSGSRISQFEIGTSFDDPAYAIYTSGTTGRPKGVPITHRSVCNLVRAEGRIFQVRPDDRVYQGFSIAFDAAVEEVWLAFFSGGTLVAATDEMIHAGPGLARMLSDAKISVLSTVPTLLAMLSDDVPSVRLLILGGEACPPQLVDRWWKPGRRMVNTYGPTEATVIATFSDLHPGKPVTIGRAVPNYRIHVLDSLMRPVAVGDSGELHLGGVGLSHGYLNRPELTREKFVRNPFDCDGDAPILYKTGDLVRFNEQGELEFQGRIDTQVKLRGFRVELAEIESALMQCAGILGAVVTVREDVPGIQQLVGYVVPARGVEIDEASLKERLRVRLPPYMVPALIECVNDFPTLSSGKVDRKRLPAPRPRETQARIDFDPPRTETEKRIAAIWEKVFAPARVSRKDDFFETLGGHSLLAASMVSQLRATKGFESVAVLDVYHHPTLAALANHVDRSRPKPRLAIAPEPKPRASSRQYLAFCAAQAASLYFVFAFYSLQWLAPFLAFSWMQEAGFALLPSAIVALTSPLALYPLMLFAAVAVKWTVIGRYQAGTYPLWGAYHFRVWLVNQILGVVPIDYLTGSPLLNLYYRLMGCHIGQNVFIATDNIRIFDLVSIGSDSSLGADCSLCSSVAEDGVLRIGRIEIGERCHVGTSASVSDDVIMAAGSRLNALSMLPRGARVPAGEIWNGSPARRVGRAAPTSPIPRPSRRAVLFYGAWHLLGALLLDGFLLAAVLPGLLLLQRIEALHGLWYLSASPLAATCFVVSLALEIVALKWLLLGRVKPGRYSVCSGFYVRKWIIDRLMDLSLDILGPLYATLYLGPWYRMLGCKLGKNAEISTAAHTSPDLLEVGDESFLADGVVLGAPEVEEGILTLANTRIGKGAFIGNSAVVPAGHTIGDDCLLGVLSAPPISSDKVTPPGTSWLGSPAIFLPRRAVNREFSAETTYKPPRRLILLRALIELLRITLPATAMVLLTSVLIEAVSYSHVHLGWKITVALFPMMFFLCAVGASLLVVAAKWALMGRFRPGEKPLWSRFVWLNELVTALHENIANPLLVEHLMGTAFAAWFFRMMGSKIGSRVYLETTQFTEYDLIRIGDEACINEDGCRSLTDRYYLSISQYPAKAMTNLS